MTLKIRFAAACMVSAGLGAGLAGLGALWLTQSAIEATTLRLAGEQRHAATILLEGYFSHFRDEMSALVRTDELNRSSDALGDIVRAAVAHQQDGRLRSSLSGQARALDAEASKQARANAGSRQEFERILKSFSELHRPSEVVLVAAAHGLVVAAQHSGHLVGRRVGSLRASAYEAIVAAVDAALAAPPGEVVVVPVVGEKQATLGLLLASVRSAAGALLVVGIPAHQIVAVLAAERSRTAFRGDSLGQVLIVGDDLRLHATSAGGKPGSRLPGELSLPGARLSAVAGLSEATAQRAVRAALRGEEGTVDAGEGGAKLAYGPLESLGRRWAVLALAGTHEARATLFGVVLATVAGGLLALLVAWVIGGRAAKRFQRPLEQLAAASLALAGGDLQARAVLPVDDGARRLADAFNKMAEAVSENAKRLEREIEERTQVATELEQSRARLASLSAHLHKVREQERARIAREVHDQLGQLMTAIKIELRTLRKKVERLAPELLPRVDEAVDVAAQALTTVRRVASDLRPGQLDTLGLAAAIEWVAEEYERKMGVHTGLWLTQSELGLDDDQSTALYRIFEEALTNVTRHADARSVQVHLSVMGGRVCLRVLDDGRGIDPKVAAAASSLGLLGMGERVRVWGGDVQITRRESQGTCVEAWLPTEAPENEL